jgi:hypothetical protein
VVCAGCAPRARTLTFCTQSWSTTPWISNAGAGDNAAMAAAEATAAAMSVSLGNIAVSRLCHTERERVRERPTPEYRTNILRRQQPSLCWFEGDTGAVVCEVVSMLSVRRKESGERQTFFSSAPVTRPRPVVQQILTRPLTAIRTQVNVSWGPRAPPLLERTPSGTAHGSGPREFDHPLREKGVEGGETGLFSTYRTQVVPAVKLLSATAFTH